MKISIPWLKELVDLNCSVGELINLLPLRSVSIKEVIGDSVELDMKGYNRADLLSLRGVAREVSAITGSKTQFGEPEEAKFVWNNKDLPSTKVTVEDSKLCPFYCIAKIEGLKVDPSREYWVKKLAESGFRSVDNITDVTNLIMQEYGQPMHAFDAKAVKDEEIIVRTAKKGERITTLDGKTRDLETADLLIADSLNALGIAGVMGGKDSEINSATSAILLEAAIFDPVNIRKTSTRLGLTSEASKRFQHGLTKKRLLQALDAAIKMYQQLGGKLTAVTMVGDFEDKVRKVTLTKKKLEELVGIKFEDREVADYLEKLHFKLASHSSSGNVVWEVEPPYYRLDIDIEEDVIEEVARMYGYEKIPSKEVPKTKPLQKEDLIFKTISDLKEKLVKEGLTEVQTYSFYSTNLITALDWDDQKEKLLVKVANPISQETEYLRQSIWPNLVETVGKNMRKGYKDIGIFEVGKAFSVDPDGKPTEDYRLAIALCNGTDNPLAELYQMAKDLESHLGGVTFKQTHPPKVVAHLFHPTRHIGGLAEVHLRMLNKLGISEASSSQKLGVEKRVAVMEIEINQPLQQRLLN